jgi:hypothetical protein
LSGFVAKILNVSIFGVNCDFIYDYSVQSPFALKFKCWQGGGGIYYRMFDVAYNTRNFNTRNSETENHRRIQRSYSISRKKLYSL